jgi:hypothetical protein
MIYKGLFASLKHSFYSRMHLWVALKYSPLALRRDINTHVNSWRLDGRWWLPKEFDYEYPLHVEILLTQACAGQCPLCARLGPLTRVMGVHYATYSVDRKNGGVFRSLNRHVTPPLVTPENNESWRYFRTPITSVNALKSFAFLELQLNKPIRNRFLWNFLCLCRRDGARKGDNFSAVASWHCAELASATLMQVWPEYEEQCTQDPCLVSPCILDLQLRDLIPTGPLVDIRILPVLPR